MSTGAGGQPSPSASAAQRRPSGEWQNGTPVGAGLTVRELLDLPELRVAAPDVLAGAENLDNSVRWIQIGARIDVVDCLYGGELILSTGASLRACGPDYGAFARDLHAATVAGLIVELDSELRQMPEDLVTAAAIVGLPVIALRREIRFVAVSEAALSLIANRQHDDLALVAQAQDTLLELCATGASIQDLLDACGEMMGAPLVLEDMNHLVLALYDAGLPAVELLQDWQLRSARVACDLLPGQPGPENWLTANLDQDLGLGRLILLASATPTAAQSKLLQFCARAIAVLEHAKAPGHRSHATSHAKARILSDIIHRDYIAPMAIYARAQASGVNLKGSLLVPIVVSLHPSGSNEPDVADALIGPAAVKLGQGALSSPLTPGRHALLTASSSQRDWEQHIAVFAKEVRDRGQRLGLHAVVAVPEPVTKLEDVPQAIVEAQLIADAAQASVENVDYHTWATVGLPGVLALLTDRAVLRAYARRLLQPLIASDEKRDGQLVDTLRCYLDHRGNKVATARDMHISRQTLHDRVRTIERLLAVSLNDGETCTSLHLATIMLDVMHRMGMDFTSR
ncbi:PucR family transcriptional regulator [Rhodococcus sp. JS3073]|uniref:PucR family transcriptional regulator n=1 Tax=Rhodococcus sp. JS3073 TaxID=3002901 RepID=UPI0022863674|nr:PucR family transcriptional regulator [Rhodococcus sp. JS3073]WAM19188.1 PucR family transcriptional regulator [Rhodococcus sp. JS3073]